MATVVRRLRTRDQFQAVLDARVVARTAHFALHRCTRDMPGATRAMPEPVGTSLVGALTPKRWARRAVTRNLIRRQIYSACERHSERLLVAAHVVRLRSPFDPSLYPSASSVALRRAVRAELDALLRQLPAQGSPS